MTLALLQRQLSQLVRGEQVGPFVDPYLNEVASSVGLEAIREISRSWNEFSLDRLCPLTCRLLRRRGALDAALTELGSTKMSSGFVEDLAAVFLDQLMRGSDPVVADIARFERAMLTLALGLSRSETVVWDHHPDELLGRILAGEALEELSAETHRTLVSLDLPNFYRLCDPTA